jgi:hypothetical protein
MVPGEYFGCRNPIGNNPEKLKTKKGNRAIAQTALIDYIFIPKALRINLKRFRPFSPL